MSTVTGIFSTGVISMRGLSLHPNPASERAILEIDKSVISSYDLIIFDQMGRVVREYRAQNGETLLIDKENLNPGLYQALLKYPNGSSSFRIMFSE